MTRCRSCSPSSFSPSRGSTRTRASGAHANRPHHRYACMEAVPGRRAVSSRRIAVFDTTLRDGEQSPGIALRPEEKAQVAGQLERLGVDVIEAGFAAASPGDAEGVRAVGRAVGSVTVASLARTRREDIDAAVDALEGAPRSRLHVFLATSPIHMEKKLRMTPDEVVAEAGAAVAHPRGRVDEVEFSCEDATRSEPAFVARVCAAAVAAGADVINLPDTTGYALPTEDAAFIREVVRRCPSLRNVTLSAHCHDDLGLAVANSLAAVDAGVGQVECTVNGIGERAGGGGGNGGGGGDGGGRAGRGAGTRGDHRGAPGGDRAHVAARRTL